jgi:hypothetical protein
MIGTLFAYWLVRPFAKEALRKRKELATRQKASRVSPTSHLPMSPTGAPPTEADHERARIQGQAAMRKIREGRL